MPGHDYRIIDIGDNGEFRTFATVELLVDDKVVHTEQFNISSEFGDTHSATEHALSYAQAWIESQIYSLEERLGPFGIEWEREQEERYAMGA